MGTFIAVRHVPRQIFFYRPTSPASRKIKLLWALDRVSEPLNIGSGGLRRHAGDHLKVFPNQPLTQGDKARVEKRFKGTKMSPLSVGSPIYACSVWRTVGKFCIVKWPNVSRLIPARHAMDALAHPHKQPGAEILRPRLLL